MSNWPFPLGSLSESLGLDVGTGTVVTTGNAVKGAWATLGVTSFRWEGLLLSIVPGTSAIRARFDVAYLLGGAEVIVAEDLFVDFAGSTSDTQTLFLPVQIPNGATLKVRAQSTVATSLPSLASGFGGGIGGDAPRRIVGCTDFTGVIPTNTVVEAGQAWTAWTTIRAVTPATVQQLLIATTGAGDNTRTASNLLVQIGVGAAGAERAIGTIVAKQPTGAMFTAYGTINCDVPAGSRLSFRVQCASASAADTVAVACSGVTA